MPASNVQWPLPLTRLNPWFPGQFGVPGTANETGLRQHSTGAIFYVDPNHVDNNDWRDGTDPTAPLTTVAAALTRCQPYAGDVIAVMANNANPYHNGALGNLVPILENVVVTVPGVRIVGVCPSGSAGVVWSPANPAGGTPCITVLANDVLIEGFYFTPGLFGGSGIVALFNGTNAFADYLTVRNCTFDVDLQPDIVLEYTWYCQIYNNWFINCDGYAIYVDPLGSGIRYCDIYDNWFQNCVFAISVPGAEQCNIYSNRIYNGQAQAGAAATDRGIDTTAGSRNIVSDNYLSCVLPVAAPGDYNDFNTASATDAWIGNHCMNGLAITNPT